MGKIVIIMVVLITAIIATMMVSVNQRSENIPEILAENFQDVGSYALQYAVNQVVMEQVTNSIVVDYSGDPFEVLSGQINSIEYVFVTATIGDSTGDNGGGGDAYTIEGDLNINPGNSTNNEFQMETPSGFIDRDEVHTNAPEFSYSGIATVVRVKPKAQGRTLTINGADITLRTNVRYTITSDNMTVNLWNDHINNGKAMGRWWITIKPPAFSIERLAVITAIRYIQTKSLCIPPVRCTTRVANTISRVTWSAPIQLFGETICKRNRIFNMLIPRNVPINKKVGYD